MFRTTSNRKGIPPTPQVAVPLICYIIATEPHLVPRDVAVS